MKTRKYICSVLVFIIILNSYLFCYASGKLQMKEYSMSLSIPALWSSYEPETNNDYEFPGVSKEDLKEYCKKNNVALIASEAQHNAELVLFVKSGSHNDISKLSDEKVQESMRKVYGLEDLERNLDNITSEVKLINNQKFYCFSGETEIEGQQGYVRCYSTVNNAKVFVFRFVSKNQNNDDIESIMQSVSYEDHPSINKSQLLYILIAILSFLIAIRMKQKQIQKYKNS